MQQKHIVVTCNYEARKHGVHKLQLVSEATRICPQLVVVLGEDLTRFRDASKELFLFLSSFVWSGRSERLGLDETFLDVTDMIDKNVELLNLNDLRSSFFLLDKTDPTVGFAFDASAAYGNTIPAPVDQGRPPISSAPVDSRTTTISTNDQHPYLDPLTLRLSLASHLAGHLSSQLERLKGYTCSVGVSTNKLLSKLVGTVHKPQAQTTLLPPYAATEDEESTVTAFLDPFPIRKIPGIGNKVAHAIQTYVQGPTELDKDEWNPYTYIIFDDDDDAGPLPLTVHDVRTHEGISVQALERVLSGPGAQKGIGRKIFNLLHGIDDNEVSKLRALPVQISIEDSYSRLTDSDTLKLELEKLSASLIRRMHVDLVVPDDSGRWVATPTTLRLSTRLRRTRDESTASSYFAPRTSKSIPLPSFILSLTQSVKSMSIRLVNETLLALFKKLHPETTGWDLSLLNVAVTGIGDPNGKGNRDIGGMFKKLAGGVDTAPVQLPDLQSAAESAIPQDHKATDAALSGIVYLEEDDDDGTDNEVPGRGSEDLIPSSPPSSPSSPRLSPRLGAGNGSEDLLVPTQSTIISYSDLDGDELMEDDEDTPGLHIPRWHNIGLADPCPICGALMPEFAVEAHARLHLDNS